MKCFQIFSRKVLYWSQNLFCISQTPDILHFRFFSFVHFISFGRIHSLKKYDYQYKKVWNSACFPHCHFHHTWRHTVFTVWLRRGHAGFLGVILLIVLGHMVAIPTALAISEIATNKRVEGGGEYFIISRSFGLNIGATIGVALFSRNPSVWLFM